jgi:hypothetical protein
LNTEVYSSFLSIYINPGYYSYSIKVGLGTWAYADFFPEEGKIFQGGGGQKHTICLKNAQKHTIFFQKSKKKHTILAGQRGMGGKRPLLPSPADTHVWVE